MWSLFVPNFVLKILWIAAVPGEEGEKLNSGSSVQQLVWSLCCSFCGRACCHSKQGAPCHHQACSNSHNLMKPVAPVSRWLIHGPKNFARRSPLHGFLLKSLFSLESSLLTVGDEVFHTLLPVLHRSQADATLLHCIEQIVFSQATLTWNCEKQQAELSGKQVFE